MSYTTEQPSSFDFEECCICSEEFTTDADLAEHLLEHAEESEYIGDLDDRDDISSHSGSPSLMIRGSQPEFTPSDLMNPQVLPKRSDSPEVLEINSDDSTDGQWQEPVRQQPAPPVRPNNRNQMRNGLFRSVGRPPIGNKNAPAPKQQSQMVPPFNCNTCSKIFTDPKLFRDHLLTHEKPRPYSCNICNKTFAYKGTLRQHLKLHIGEKLHECPTCHKRFTIKAVLKKHCEEVHGSFTSS